MVINKCVYSSTEFTFAARMPQIAMDILIIVGSSYSHRQSSISLEQR